MPNAAPTVISTSPVDAATGVAINQRIAATFSEGMNASTLDAAFTVTGPGASPVAGTIAYDAPSNIATFTPAPILLINTAYTATITTAAQNMTGVALAGTFTWSFTTGVTSDTTAPTIVSTNPNNAATDVPINKKITATFSEAMDPLTISTANYAVTGPGASPVSGTVTFAAVGATATFTPAANLAVNTVFTATITTAVRDLAGNALAANKVWTFTTGTSADTTAPTIISTNPNNGDMGVQLNRKINATFSEPIDPSTISTSRFFVTGPGATNITGTISYDAAGNIATFSPLANFAPDTLFTATITTGVRDLAGNALVSAFVWSFTTGTTLAQAPVNLRSLSTFVAVAGAGLTNSNSAGQTTLNGDVGLSPAATCLGDGSPCSAINPLINGTLYANDPGGVAAAAKSDLTLVYVEATGRPPGTTVNDLSGMVLAPGVYTSGSTMSIAVGGTLTLDAQGDANAVWIFQIGSSLTVNNNAQVLLINGAKAANVYWAIFASSTLGTNVSFKGNVFAGSSNSMGTGSTLEGRMLCTTGQITLLSNTLTLPVP
jgi:methionine-rich copper-binding protein CopC